MKHRFSMRGLIAIVLGLGGLACGEEGVVLDREVAGENPGVVPPDPGGEVIAVRDPDFNAGELPAASTDAALPKIVNLRGPAAVTNGGTVVLHVQLSSPVPSPTFAVQLAGEAGYHTVIGTDPEGDAVVDISIRVGSEVTASSVVFSVALLDAAGNAGEARQIEIPLVQSGTGDVKVTLSFDRLHDLDLHVIEPTGEEIFYQQPTSTAGGRLDLDSGAHCQPSPANTENVFWPPAGAPKGRYGVSVQNYEQCSPGPITFTVTIIHAGAVETYEGSFPDGTAGEAPTATNVRQIATFDL